MAPPLAETFDPALQQRTMSAAVMAAATLVAVLVGGWLFVLLVLLVAVVMAGEWTRLVPTPAIEMRALTAIAAGLVPVLAAIALATGRDAAAVAILLLGAVVVAGIAAAMPAGLPDRAVGGLLYVGLPVLALIWLRTSPHGGLGHVLWLLFVVWATDICAYFAGRSIGGPKLAPRISPGKTWSGLGGGMLGAGVVGGVGTLAADVGFWLGAAFAMVLAVVAQIGDLFESRLKRLAEVKDSGHLIPGHGGLLDRIDGLVFAAPVFVAVVWLMSRGAPS